MATLPVPGDDYGWDLPVLNLLNDNILNEINAQTGLMQLSLNDEQRINLAWAVTAHVQYAFDVDWNPKWLNGSAGDGAPPD